MTLIGYWPLNEESGDKAYDYSGNENHGGLENNPEISVKGILNENSYGFNRSDSDRIRVDNSSELNPDRVSVSAWVYPLSEGVKMQIIAKAGDTGKGYILQTNDDGFPWFRVSDGDYTPAQSDKLLLSDQWTFLTGTFNGSTIKIYVNGELKDQASSGAIEDDSDDLMIAAHANSPSRNNFDGRITETRLYNRALTASEVQYLYNVSRRGRFSSRKRKARKTE